MYWVCIWRGRIEEKNLLLRSKIWNAFAKICKSFWWSKKKIMSNKWKENWSLKILTLTTTWFAKVQSHQLHHIGFQKIYIPNVTKIWDKKLDFLRLLEIIIIWSLKGTTTRTTMEHVQVLSANTFPMYRMLMLNHRLLSAGFQHLRLKFAWVLCQPPHSILFANEME